MKQTDFSKKERFLSGLFLILTAGVVIGMFCFNFNGRAFYNCDMYSDALVAKEMWTEKTLFPENWVFGNQFYIAATPVLAALMYGIMGDSYLALSAASCLMTVFILLSFIYCMKEAIDKKYLPLGLFCISGAGIICTGACSNVYGWQIFYTMASYYAAYFIGILLSLGVWLRLKKYNKVNPAAVILVLILNCALGMNSLRQTLTGCLPLVALDGLIILTEIIRQKKLAPVIKSNLKRVMFSVGALIFNLAGVVIVKFLDINSDPIIEETRLSYLPSEIFKNLIATMKSIATILGFSVYDRGVEYVPLLIVAAVFLLIAVTAVIFIIKNKDESPLTYLITFSFISLAALAFTGVFILRTRHIYYFVWFFMLTCSIIYLAVRFKGKAKNSFLVIILICGIINCTYSFYNDYKKYSERHEGFERIADTLIDDGVEYLFTGMEFNSRVAAYSEDKFTHGMLFWDFNKETGNFLYPIWYIQSRETFEHITDENAVFGITDKELSALSEKASKEFYDDFFSCLELYKSIEGPEGVTYYFYHIKKDIASDFGVTANIKDPLNNQLLPS